MKDIYEIFDSIRFHPENETFEFKEAKSNFDFDEMGKYFSALSNEANIRNRSFAWLVFGVHDKSRDIVGTDYKSSPQSLEKLKNDLAQHLTDKNTFREIFVLTIDNKRVLLFQIPAANKGVPVAWKGHYYGRNGESLDALNSTKYDYIRKQIAYEDWSAAITPNAMIDDLDENAINKARELYANKHEHLREEMNTWDNLTFLNKAKITRQGKITNTAIILLGKEESEVLLSPNVAKIRWILKDGSGNERDYLIISCPFVLNVEVIYNKIRNLKYRYINPYFQSLFPNEIDTYEPYVIREALNNAIAHQDYSMRGMINVVENDEQLIFSNVGSFIPQSLNYVLKNDAPEEVYRNSFLAQAMVEIKMVDTIGSGIKRMFNYQKKRLFPMPDYDFSDNKVKLTILGKIIDINYAMMLSKMDLSLEVIELLNRVQLKKELSDAEIDYLRTRKLIEGRKPNIFIAKSVAQATNNKISYTKTKGLDDNFYCELIITALKQHSQLSRKDFEDLLLNKLPEHLSESQKINKIKNLLTSLRKKGTIAHDNKNKRSLWFLNAS